MINGISGINGITYSPNDLPHSNTFLHFFNEAIAAGYDPSEARKWAKKKVEKEKKQKPKEKKKENINKSNHIDRRA